jgi:DNA-binding LacI/PurR family transcriptional regulator/DNA-binding GntR family transcriptional regulator
MAAGSDLLESVVARLRALVRESDAPKLPAMKELARVCGASRTVVARAAGILRDEGLISFTRGQRIHIPANLPDASSPTRRSSVATLAASLEARIETGHYRAGQRLPKMAALAAAFHVSNTTIAGALRELSSRRLVHKRGKAWYVGGEPVDRGRIRVSATHRVVIVLQDREHEWVWLSRLARTGRFCSRFIAEAEVYGVSLVSAFPDGVALSPGTRYVGAGRVDALIRELGSRYLGSLVVSSAQELPGLAAWIDRLCAYRKPVVWFDRYDRPPRGLAARRHFTRCRFAEENGLALAVKALADAGHRECVFPISAPGFMAWQYRRRDALRSLAHNAGIRLRSFEHMVNDIHGNPWQSEEGTMETYEPVARKILDHRGATALIAPNDYTAFFYYHWLSEAGVAIPERLSLISFDNDVACSLLPLSTIDFGLGYLGYAAFHLLFGIVPVARERTNTVSSRPRLLDRGSLGPPRKGVLWANGGN